ncbi:uncharacterized protein LOC144659771 isoform X1 [Oculina patagonica]
MLITLLFLFFLQSVCPKVLPGAMPGVELEQVDPVGNTSPGEENPLKCQDEEDCWFKSRDRVGRSSQAELNKRETNACDQLPADEKVICNLFAGKRELPARRDLLVNRLLRTFYEPGCKYPFCKYTPGRKKFMVKKDAREENANAVSSDTNGRKQCDDAQDLFCSGNSGLGRKRSIRTELDQDSFSCEDPQYSNTELCRWSPPGKRRKRTISSLDNSAQ